jgi:hypothetical protein
MMPPPRYVILFPVAGSVLIFAGFPGLLTKSRSQLRGIPCAPAVAAAANNTTSGRACFRIVNALLGQVEAEWTMQLAPKKLWLEESKLAVLKFR